MRKVLYKKWVKGIPNGLEFPYNGYIEGTNCWAQDFLYEGIFHQWAPVYEEFTSGFGNYTVALVETPDGTIDEVLPSNIKFINEETTNKNKQSLTSKASSFLKENEEKLIKESLKRNNGNKVRTAKELGIATRTLYRKLMRYDNKTNEEEE